MSYEAFTFCEFFAGGGMARAGLGDRWRCTFANDFDPRKSAAYIDNWGDGEMLTQDIRKVTLADMPAGRPNLVWASFPCQDLSLAGAGAGLKGDRSGTFWPFWDRIRELCADDRAPQAIVLENVLGTLSAHGGKDFEAIVRSTIDAGYDVGALVIDAELFVPQSRPRVFFIAVRRLDQTRGKPTFVQPSLWQPQSLCNAVNALPASLRTKWLSWNPPPPKMKRASLVDIVEDGANLKWHSLEQTNRLLDLMSPLHRQKVELAKQSKQKTIGTVYRRMRPAGDGTKIQRAEVRFDDTAGCLRTPAGGSSRQLILVVDGKSVRTRLISARETARLMGLPDSYKLPRSYNEAYHLTGDGVVVPVVRHISDHILIPYLEKTSLPVAA